MFLVDSLAGLRHANLCSYRICLSNVAVIDLFKQLCVYFVLRFPEVGGFTFNVYCFHKLRVRLPGKIGS